MGRSLTTRSGSIQFPAFLPVTTFGGKFPLDEVVRPYLGRLAPAAMASHYYAQQMKTSLDLPLFVDSGGFASMFEGSKVVEHGDLAVIETKDGTVIHPAQVLAFQEQHADIGATVDFLIPPQMEEEEAQWRQDLTVRNALWALQNRAGGGFRLYASVQAWDAPSALRVMEQLAGHPFDGFALGGMVPRIGQPDGILEIVRAIRHIEPDRPLHVFGIGQPALLSRLFAEGVDSSDSSSYVQNAAGKKYLDPTTGQYERLEEMEEPRDMCECHACQRFSKAYFTLPGELNSMALALHNLAALGIYLGLPGGIS